MHDERDTPPQPQTDRRMNRAFARVRRTMQVFDLHLAELRGVGEHFLNKLETIMGDREQLDQELEEATALLAAYQQRDRDTDAALNATIQDLKGKVAQGMDLSAEIAKVQAIKTSLQSPPDPDAPPAEGSGGSGGTGEPSDPSNPSGEPSSSRFGR